jgi:hypothetical protein
VRNFTVGTCTTSTAPEPLITFACTGQSRPRIPAIQRGKMWFEAESNLDAARHALKLPELPQWAL